MSGPKDPLQPLPDPWRVPPDYPVFTDPTPTPPPSTSGRCPHCDTAWLSGKGGHAQEDEAGICATCCGLVIATPDGGWRIAGYDEAERWDRDPRIIAMRRIWGEPLPGPDGEHG